MSRFGKGADNSDKNGDDPGSNDGKLLGEIAKEEPKRIQKWDPPEGDGQSDGKKN